jgi:glycosyltransferase involved in cell wall biosynthesis
VQDNGTPKAVLVGTAPPRRCGIATFTDDLRRALSAAGADTPAVQVALTDDGGSYDYGPEVVYEVQADRVEDFRAAADFINGAEFDVLCVQHEFGIFGGVAGAHVDELLEHVRVPVVTTLHTVLPDPSPELAAATRRLADRSDVLVVLAEQAVDLLVEGCGVDRDKVRVIPHGVPAGPRIDQDKAKEGILARGRTVLLTFGLLSPGKGVEVVLEALPDVVAQHPDVLYVVLGATHPHVLRDGDDYRLGLQARAEELGVQDHVRFVDRYVELEELRRHLAASDVYITPYHGSDQIVSGTLAYAVGSGCVVVSTPYAYARELLADGRGELVPFRDPVAMAKTLIELLGDDQRRTELARRARAHGEAMSWPSVGATYQDLFTEVVERHEARPLPRVAREVPAPRFDHLRALTDDVGVFQHAPHGIPERAHGYCTDDVGRALVVAVEGAVSRGTPWPPTGSRLPVLLQDAQQPNGRFANLMSYDRRFQESTASQDTLGQAVWGLGVTVGTSPDRTGARWPRRSWSERAAVRPPDRDARRGVRHDRLGRLPGALPGRAARPARAADHSLSGSCIDSPPTPAVSGPGSTTA